MGHTLNTLPPAIKAQIRYINFGPIPSPFPLNGKLIFLHLPHHSGEKCTKWGPADKKSVHLFSLQEHYHFQKPSLLLHFLTRQKFVWDLGLIANLLLTSYICRIINFRVSRFFTCILLNYTIYIYLSVCLSIHLSINLSIYLSIYHSIIPSFYLSIIQSFYHSIILSIYHSIIIPSFYLSIIQSFNHSIILSIYLSIYLPTYLPTYLSIYLSIYLSLYFQFSSGIILPINRSWI